MNVVTVVNWQALGLFSSDGNQREKERRRRRHGSPSDEEDSHKSQKKSDYESSRRGDKVLVKYCFPTLFVCFIVRTFITGVEAS